MSPENSKPEWFQLADGDAILPRPRSKRAVRIMALATPLLVLGAGLVFAQTQESPSAVASAVTSPAPRTTQVSYVATSPPTSSPSITIRKPAIASMPTGGGGDDALRNSDDD